MEDGCTDKLFGKFTYSSVCSVSTNQDLLASFFIPLFCHTLQNCFIISYNIIIQSTHVVDLPLASLHTGFSLEAMRCSVCRF